jgi:hypothetical protein
MSNPAMPEAASIMRRGISRDTSNRTREFSESLSAASRELAGSKGEQRAASAKELSIGELIRTSAALTESTTTESGSSERTRGTSESASTGSRVVTPFDNTATDETPTSGDKKAEWRDYFRTHAPSEWWTNDTARGHFQEIYGDNALVALDWTCNVPENIEPNFVLHVPLDPTGKPIPGSKQG